MNLGIEYLIRTGTIRNFLQTPCSLCLETAPHRSKVVVTLDRHPDHHFCIATRWNLEKLEDAMPVCKEYDVRKSEVFTSNVLEGTPIRYKERPIEAYCNHYAHPMDDHTYSYFISNFLNSEYHKSSRMSWLWRAFVKLNFSLPLLELRYYERRYNSRIMECEQIVVMRNHESEWDLWCDWERKLLKSGPVAAELIFLTN